MTDLEPCPFCGRIPKVYDSAGNILTERKEHYIKCKCGMFITFYPQSRDRESLIKKFNRREKQIRLL